MISYAEQHPVPPLKALILAGGKSTRMGRDKSLLDYHGVPQWIHLSEMCRSLGFDVFLSCRQEQHSQFKGAEIITDLPGMEGPLGAIVSALSYDAQSAWLVLACDLPLLEITDLFELIDGRVFSKCATAYQSPFDGKPEPLIAIWEPTSKEPALQLATQGIHCPRKVLEQCGVHLLRPSHPERLANINTPQEFEKLYKLTA